MDKSIVLALSQILYIFFGTFWIYSIADYIKQRKFTFGFGFTVMMFIHLILTLINIMFK